MTLLYEWKKALEQMRRDGFAVTVIDPDELCGASPIAVEEAMLDVAHNVIDCWQEG